VIGCPLGPGPGFPAARPHHDSHGELAIHGLFLPAAPSGKRIAAATPPLGVRRHTSHRDNLGARIGSSSSGALILWPVGSEQALLSLELPSRAGAAGAARKALTALNGSLHLVSPERLQDAQLLISEVVSNAVRHGGDGKAPIDVTIRADPAVMRIEVRDQGPGFDPAHLPLPSAHATDRWGLQLVAALAHRWGAETAGETTVWFEIDRPQRAQPLPPEPTQPQ
jgi:anti-sigma regulatory factor (Ser/Thr protein kinase)